MIVNHLKSKVITMTDTFYLDIGHGFEAIFVCWENGATGAYLPIEIAHELVDADFDYALMMDDQLYVSTKELMKFTNHHVVYKIHQELKMVSPALRRMRHRKVVVTY